MSTRWLLDVNQWAPSEDDFARALDLIISTEERERILRYHKGACSAVGYPHYSREDPCDFVLTRIALQHLFAHHEGLQQEQIRSHQQKTAATAGSGGVPVPVTALPAPAKFSFTVPPRAATPPLGRTEEGRPCVVASKKMKKSNGTGSSGCGSPSHHAPPALPEYRPYSINASHAGPVSAIGSYFPQQEGREEDDENLQTKLFGVDVMPVELVPPDPSYSPAALEDFFQTLADNFTANEWEWILYGRTIAGPQAHTDHHYYPAPVPYPTGDRVDSSVLKRVRSLVAKYDGTGHKEDTTKKDPTGKTEGANGKSSAPICLKRFFVLWTLKESYIKAVGIGLSFPLLSAEFRIEPVHDAEGRCTGSTKCRRSASYAPMCGPLPDVDDPAFFQTEVVQRSDDSVPSHHPGGDIGGHLPAGGRHNHRQHRIVLYLNGKREESWSFSCFQYTTRHYGVEAKEENGACCGGRPLEIVGAVAEGPVEYAATPSYRRSVLPPDLWSSSIDNETASRQDNTSAPVGNGSTDGSSPTAVYLPFSLVRLAAVTTGTPLPSSN